MSAPDLFANIKTHFINFLNCGLFTTDSLEGWLCIFILAFFLWALGKKALKFAIWSCSVIALIQIFHWLSMTSANNYIPLDKIFGYDVLGAIASCFKDARIANILNTANEHIKSVITMTWEFLTEGGLKEAINGLIPG